jgi:phosphatidate cytidylyltransferase
MSAKNNLLLRVLSGICLGAIAIWGVVWSNFVLNLLLAAGAIISGIEWTQIIEPSFRAQHGIHPAVLLERPDGFRARAHGMTLYVLSFALFILFVIGTRTHAPRYGFELASGSVLFFAYAVAFKPSLARKRDSLFLSLGFPVIGATILSLLALHQGVNWHALIFLLACVSATDIGGFAFGKMIGGKKLAPRISPNKTIAGSIGGLISAAVVAAILSHWLGEVSAFHSMIVGLALSILAQLGDLAESALKRRFSVKDSGFLIPGHGGILDRIDGLLLAAPLFTLYRLWLGGPL